MKIGSHRLIGLNTRSLVDETVLERVGSVVLLKKLSHLGQAFRFQKPTTVSFIYLVIMSPDGSSQLLLQRHPGLPAVMFPALMVVDAKASICVTPKINASFFKVTFVMVSYHSNAKVTKPLSLQENN